MRSIASVLVASLFACQIEPLRAAEGPVPDQKSIRVGRQLNELFEKGYLRGPSNLKDAQRLYEAARSEAPSDARIEYAYGLVMLKQVRNKEALAQFQTATSQPGKPYWPAWQALIWSHFTAKDYPAGYGRLLEFARRLAKSDDAEVRDSVKWIGRAVVAIEKASESVKHRQTLDQHEESLREILGEKWLADFEAGQEEVRSMHALLEVDLQQTREQTLEKKEQERLGKQTQVTKDLEVSQEKRDSLKKTAEEAKKVFDEQLKNYEKQLSALERDYGTLEKRGQALADAQLQMRRDIATLELRIMMSKPEQKANLQNQINQLQGQQTQAQVEYDRTLFAAQGVNQKAQVVVGQRGTLVQQFEKATGQLVNQDASLDKWQDRLKKNEQKLKAPANDKAPAVTGKANQVRSFRTYVDLDLIAERDKVLESFGAKASEPPEAK